MQFPSRMRLKGRAAVLGVLGSEAPLTPDCATPRGGLSEVPLFPLWFPSGTPCQNLLGQGPPTKTSLGFTGAAERPPFEKGGL